MHNTLEFPDLLRLIDERSTAFCAAVSAAPDLDVMVPTCPEWTLFDLVQHMGEGRRSWAATVIAGPSATAKADVPEGIPAPPRDRDALLAWMADSTQQLVDALREAGPDRGCWTWWAESQSPQTCGAVARHQLQQFAVHTYDAQVTVGAAQPLSDEVALDGVEEFLVTCCATTAPWPHAPAVVDYHVTEGRGWRLRLSADGARVARLPEPATDSATDAATAVEPAAADASGRSTANELVLVFYGRLPLDTLEVDGDPHLFDQLAAWEPEL